MGDGVNDNPIAPFTDEPFDRHELVVWRRLAAEGSSAGEMTGEDLRRMFVTYDRDVTALRSWCRLCGFDPDAVIAEWGKEQDETAAMRRAGRPPFLPPVDPTP